MPRSEPLPVRTVRPPPHSHLLTAFAFAASVASARGHTLLMSNGEVVVGEQGVMVELEVAAEDFVHWYGLAPDGENRFPIPSLCDAADRHAATLDRVLVVRDSAGTRVKHEPFHMRWDCPTAGRLELADLRKLRITYAARYACPDHAHFLTFQLLLDASDASVFWQLALTIRGAAGAGGVVRLTSRGNAETVTLSWQDGRATVLTDDTPQTAGSCVPCADHGVGRLHEVCADIDVSEASVEVLLMLPLPLAETWMMLPTHDGEFLDPSEQRACGEALRALMRGALSVESDGRSVVPELVEFRFVPLERTPAESAAGDTPVSLWTGRVLAHLRFRSESSLSHAGLRWALFNSAVLSAQTILRGDGTCTEHEFTINQPTLYWHPRTVSK